MAVVDIISREESRALGLGEAAFAGGETTRNLVGFEDLEFGSGGL